MHGDNLLEDTLHPAAAHQPYYFRVLKLGSVSKAPNLSSFFHRGFRVNFSRVETLQIKKLDMARANFIRDARAKLPSIMPNLETLFLHTNAEVYCRLAVVSYINSNTLLCWCIINNLNMAYLLCRWIHQCCPPNSSTSSTLPFRFGPVPMIIFLWFHSWMHLLPW